MSLMPSDAYMVTAGRTQAEFKVALETQRDVICEMPGAEAEAQIIIDGSDQITPVVGVASYRVLVNTGSFDNLAKIIPTNCRDGYLICLRGDDAAKPITVKHLAGGANQIALLGGADYVLDDLRKRIWLMFDDDNDLWEEVAPGSMRLEVKRMPGFAAAVDVSLVSDVLTVSQFATRVRPQSSTSDNCQEIIAASSGLNLIKCTVASGDTITFKNETGGGGRIYNRGQRDIILDSPDQCVIYEMRGVDAYEVGTFGVSEPILSGGRLSSSNSNPYPGDTTNAAALYFLPAGSDGNRISLYKSSQWRPYIFSSVSFTPPNLKYCPFFCDVHADSGVPAGEVRRWDGGTQVTGTITGVSIAAAAVITSNSHPLQVGDVVAIDTITGTVGTDAKAGLNSRANDVRQFTVTAITANTFTIDAISTGLAYTSGGTWYKIPARPAHGTQDGVLVKSGTPTRRVVGGGMTGFTAGQCDQTQLCAHVVSLLNPVFTPGDLSTGVTTPQLDTNSHTYNSTTPRPFENDHSKRIRWISLAPQDRVEITAGVAGTNGASVYGYSQISVNRTDGNGTNSPALVVVTASTSFTVAHKLMLAGLAGSCYATVLTYCGSASNVTFSQFTHLIASIPR